MVFTRCHHYGTMKSQKRTNDRQGVPGYTGFFMVIGWIGLALSGCATQPLNQQGSNARPGVRDPSVCRVELNEAPAKGEPGRDVPHRSEARAAAGLTGLMGGIYAEALGVHQVVAGQPEAKRTDPGPDTKDCIN